MAEPRRDSMKFETKFRKEQREAKLAVKNRGTVLWVSCYINQYGEKVQVDGTRRYKTARYGKAEKKAFKRRSHQRGYYAAQRVPAF
ncbi:MAG TPA: hypothetical protein DCS09_05835 [Porphyromonadaceae bacterium]|nr:hypothetical protein [Porphyromonadaceae bacterium]